MCDCDSATGLIDLRDAESRITNRTQALVVTHLWGQLVDMTAARRLCDRHGIALIEDASHAHSAPRGDVVRDADASVFSLGTKKLVSGGLGGAVITRRGNAADLAALLSQGPIRARRLIRDADLATFADTGLGMNLRGTPISALLALDHLESLDAIVERKNRVLRMVCDAVRASASGMLKIVEVPTDANGTLYALPMMLELGATLEATRGMRDAIVTHLRAAGLRVSAMEKSLTLCALFQRGLPVHGRTTALADPVPGADRLAASGLRFDTRDMYDPWDSEEFAELDRILAALDLPANA